MFNISTTRLITILQHHFCLLLTSLVFIAYFFTSVVTATDTQSIPIHLVSAGKHAINYQRMPLEKSQNKLLISWQQPNKSGRVEYQMTVPLADKNIQITIPKPIAMGQTHQVVRHTFTHNKQQYQLVYTQGVETGIGEFFADGKHWYFEVTNQALWLINITESALLPGLYDGDVLHQDTAPAGSSIVLPVKNSQNSEPIVVDLLLLYTPNIVARYPGEMNQTLLNHLVAKANQTFVDSDIHMQLRLVGNEFVNYTQPSDFSALNDIDAALDNNNATTPDDSLSNLATIRNQVGADIVAMIRTHDLNEREVCGVAFFPRTDSDVLINVSNVGISGGSNCLNTFTHEIGHNFGAGHQQNAGNSVGLLNFSGALIARGQYNTVMSSIGTGDVNRDFKLPLFSNLNNSCGGKVCGDAETADNARTMNEFATQNAALRAQVIPGGIIVPNKSERDADSDGVSDRNDAFPYLASETSDSDDDGIGDNTDAFPNDSTESVDTDGDGIGNNADPDDDNDGTNDGEDDLPLDPRDIRDSDNDGIGPSIDALDNDFQERFDADNDGVGDRQDLDDDNDGVPDFWPSPSLAQTRVLVVSAGTDELLQYSSSGDFQQSLVSFADGALSFRSDLLVTPEQQIYIIAFSDVYQWDIQRQELRIAIARSQLTTNFPAHIGLSGNRLIIAHGLGTSYIDGFYLGASGNVLLTSNSSTDVYRDITVFSNTSAYIAARSTNRILTVNPNISNSSFQVFAASGLNKPEHMVVNARGELLVTNAQSQDVSRFNSQGDFLGKFITAGLGGLGMPSCIEIGPQGNVYVCSSDTNQILKYDGDTGGFDSVFIEASNGGLIKPVSLQFMSQSADEFPYDPNHDSDADGVFNPDDAFPLDPNESIDTDNDGIGNNTDQDDDNDTMPDNFEIEFGFDPLDPTDAAQDADGDGITNAEEFANGTDPTVANAAPEPPPNPQPPDTSSGGTLSTLLYFLLLAILLHRRKSLQQSI